MPPFRPCSQGSPGFSLFEMAAVLTIIALVSGMALTLGSAQQESNKVALTKDRLDTIEAALIRFAKKGGYLPCPARPSLAPNNASFTVSANCTAAAPADIATTTGSGQTIWIGMVPTRSLSLPDDYAFDGWNNRIKYAVIKDLTIAASDTITDYDTSKNTGTGIIQIVDGANTPNQIPSTTEYDIVGYSVVSHGKDGKGAYRKVGGTAGACTAGYLDTENCDNDAVFVDTFFNDSTIAANYYDDYVRWALLPKLMTEAALEQWIAPPEETTQLATIATGYSQTCALKDDGSVWCWGENNGGQLGDNTLTERHTPVQAIGVTGGIEIATIAQVSYALKDDGTLWFWAPSAPGNLMPAQNSGISDLIQISGASGNLCGVKSDDTVWCSNTAALETWSDEGITDATHVAPSHYHNCALKTDGTVWCWNEGSAGELGDGACADSGTPVQVSGLTGVTGVSGTCAVKSDGTLWCWGPLANPVNSCSPVQMLTDVSQISANQDNVHACALKDDGTVWCWGANNYGQIGDGTTTIWGVTTPTQASITGVTEIAAGGQIVHGFTCAKKNDGSVWCWGNNGNGQLGDNTIIERHTPVQVQNFP